MSFTPGSVSVDAGTGINVATIPGSGGAQLQLMVLSEGKDGAPTPLDKQVGDTHAGTDRGLLLLAVRKDTAAALAADGKYVPCQVDDGGALRTRIVHMPAGDRETDSVSAAKTGDAMMMDHAPYQVLRAWANISASTTDGAFTGGTIPSLDSGFKYRIVWFHLHARGTATQVTFNSKPSGAGTAMSPTYECGVNSGRSEGPNEYGWFETSNSNGITVTTGAGSTVGVAIGYVKLPN